MPVSSPGSMAGEQGENGGGYYCGKLTSSLLHGFAVSLGEIGLSRYVSKDLYLNDCKSEFASSNP